MDTPSFIDTVPLGIYRHYKHDPTVSDTNYTYEVVGVAQHTEEAMCMVIYRPLYPCDIRLFVRPIAMFLSRPNSRDVPRFRAVTDHDELVRLQTVMRPL